MLPQIALGCRRHDLVYRLQGMNLRPVRLLIMLYLSRGVYLPACRQTADPACCSLTQDRASLKSYFDGAFLLITPHCPAITFLCCAQVLACRLRQLLRIHQSSA